MKNYMRVCARVDLDAIEYNIEKMKENIKEGTKMLAVIKTDGYGHGAIPIARILEDKEYIWGYATAAIEEAVALKKAGITKPILVLGNIFSDQWEEMLKYEIRCTISSEERAKEISDLAVKIGKKAYVHIKLDTGMSRLGFPISEESKEHIVNISKMPNIVLEGMYTHFSKADEVSKDFTYEQMKGYIWLKDALKAEGVTFSYYHCSNSAGIIDVPDANMDLVRAGISTYGLYPSEDVIKKNVPLHPALELISHVSHVKWVDVGTPVSYGGTFITGKKTKIATIPVGYGDGYPRSLSNKGHVLIRGKKAPILGRICMDQFMVDVTSIDDVEYEDKVTLVGFDGNEHISVEELGDLSGRFNYEFVCDLGKRIPREYLRGGKVIEQIDYFS